MAEEKEEKVEKPEVEKVAAAGEQSGDKGVPFSEHPRWKEVYGAYKEYKEIGMKPQELRAALAEAEQLKQAFQEASRLAAEEARKTSGDVAAEEQLRLAREQLKKIFPEIDEIESLKAAREAANARLENAALSETKRLMAEVGMDTDRSDMMAMSDILADVIKNDPELLSEYATNPKEAVKGAWTQMTAKFEKISDRAAKAKKQGDREAASKLPKAHGGGGEGHGAEGKEGPPKNMAEATARAIQRLKGMEL